MTGLTGRAYLERGEPVIVITAFCARRAPDIAGSWLDFHWPGRRPAAGPRNVAIRRADGTTTVRPFRGLTRAPDTTDPLLIPRAAADQKEETPVARIIATIKPVHADKSVCTHQVSNTGQPKDPASGCTGRTGYTARCSACSWRQTHSTRTALEGEGDSHLRTHLTTPAHTH
ncbi:hypothetical protein GCM10017744_102950 [Streptomyces antimycoticus]|uniref:Uncharacterized protein n=1 Tax=Streptomyces antimycoticus TaxID=68175 RepID=A0A4D4KTZ2_9ACTN|nr:hypothetical protein [Streptomyces antimycoticus]GDY49329.1 hypothetical protein SANT12839_102110 [Streptomyces antimycoticus]